MKKQLSRWLLLLGAAALIGGAGCKAKPKDADVRTAVETALRADPETAGLMVDVKDGVAVVRGEVKDETARNRAAELAGAVKGVRSVQNDVSVAPPPPPPVQVTADDALVSAVRDATKDYPKVTATVKDGVIHLSGEISSASWKKLKPSLDGLKPKRVDPSGLKIK